MSKKYSYIQISVSGKMRDYYYITVKPYTDSKLSYPEQLAQLKKDLRAYTHRVTLLREGLVPDNNYQTEEIGLDLFFKNFKKYTKLYQERKKLSKLPDTTMDDYPLIEFFLLSNEEFTNLKHHKKLINSEMFVNILTLPYGPSYAIGTEIGIGYRLLPMTEELFHTL